MEAITRNFISSDFAVADYIRPSSELQLLRFITNYIVVKL
jgi:hypothetical protein